MLRLIAAGLVLVTVSAAAEDTPKPAKDKMICRRDETVGTRLSRRTCMTASQWRSLEGAQRQSMLDLADHAEQEGRQFEQSYNRPQN